MAGGLPGRAWGKSGAVPFSDQPGKRAKKKQPEGCFLGGLEEIRTPDPHNANVVRSQLRYKPVFITGIL